MPLYWIFWSYLFYGCNLPFVVLFGGCFFYAMIRLMKRVRLSEDLEIMKDDDEKDEKIWKIIKKRYRQN